MPESKSRGAIPRLIIFIIGLIFGLWFAIPGETDLGIMILEALAKAIQPLNVEQANQMVAMYIILFRILGIVLIAADILGICILFRRRQYF
jgi:hypothetical protein